MSTCNPTYSATTVILSTYSELSLLRDFFRFGFHINPLCYLCFWSLLLTHFACGGKVFRDFIHHNMLEFLQCYIFLLVSCILFYMPSSFCVILHICPPTVMHITDVRKTELRTKIPFNNNKRNHAAYLNLLFDSPHFGHFDNCEQ